jgi:hypothetical protein
MKTLTLALAGSLLLGTAALAAESAPGASGHAAGQQTRGQGAKSGGTTGASGYTPGADKSGKTGPNGTSAGSPGSGTSSGAKR